MRDFACAHVLPSFVVAAVWRITAMALGATRITLLLALVVAGANGQSYSLVPDATPYTVCSQGNTWVGGDGVLDTAWACAHGYGYFANYLYGVAYFTKRGGCDLVASNLEAREGGPQVLDVRALPPPPSPPQPSRSVL